MQVLFILCRTLFVSITLFIATIVLMPLSVSSVHAADESDDVFERSVRPILVEQCSGCHGSEKQNGGLRVDSLAALLQGGDTGPAIVPGKSAQSLLVQAVQRSEDLAMPPDGPLKPQQVAALRHWIDAGAVWPASVGTLKSMTDQSVKQHWAFQPVSKPPVPETPGDWGQTPIDAFVLQALTSNALRPSVRADRRTLLRRASYVVTGLAPSPKAVADFESDQRPDAWERVVDRLLASEHYGEHWARHWLDVARYADTKGYVYAREERFWVHAWTYRDWVIKALNSDLPYNRFLQLQLAADQVADRQPGDLAAMGFLTLGRRFLGLTHDIIDDRIDVVCRGTMGLTVSCARCHDHKYDPIPTTDYYALYGVFDSCGERLEPLKVDSAASSVVIDTAFADGLAERLKKLADSRTKHCNAASAQIRARVGEYLMAQTELHKYPQAGFDQVIVAADLHPRIVSRWQMWLYNAARRQDPVFRAWHAYQPLAEESFADAALAVTQELADCPAEQLNPLVASALVDAPKSFLEVVDRYRQLLTDVEAQWMAALKSAADSQQPVPLSLDDPAAEQLRQVLYGPGSPCVVPDEHISNTELLFTTNALTEQWQLQNEVDRWIINAQADLPFAVTLFDRAVPSEPRVFLRGNPANLGEPVPRRFLTLLSSPESSSSFRLGSGRKELADAIIDPANPLTARVIVNRVWANMFGRGLVRTPSDFGLRAERPSHPELLDWLTSWFVEHDWSLKQLQRLILTSDVFQQASREIEGDSYYQAILADPENRLLWRMTPHRLTFEEFRDSLLQAAGLLDDTMGGKPVDLFKTDAPNVRRTVYGLIDRQFLPGTFRTFDFASPDLHIAQRSETTVPQQALFLLNHRLVLDQAKQLAKNTEQIADTAERVQQLFNRTLQRAPTPAEAAEALQLLTVSDVESREDVPPLVAEWSYGYGEVDESVQQVVDFRSAPHFTGTAWQGGANWPDAKLGWVNLTAVGGHPGNSRQHACVRRWTAPREMTVRIESKLIHEPAVGDGIRAFVLATSGGERGRQLHAVTAHQQTVSLDTVALPVSAGNVIDFVVDINNELNSDQFRWQISIRDAAAEADDGSLNNHSQWNSETDFTRRDVPSLSPWEQLAHVLLCTNEFMFVD